MPINPYLGPSPKQTAFPVITPTQGGPGTPTLLGPTINGTKMPGRWLLTDCEHVFGWEEQAGAYLSGAVPIPKGDPLMRVTYDIQFTSSADVAAYMQLLQTTLKKPVVTLAGTGTPTVAASAALGIDDPQLKAIGLTKVLVVSVTPPMNPFLTSGGKGPWTAKVKFLQYRKIKAAPPLPDQTIPDPGAVSPSAVQNAALANANIAQQHTNVQNAMAQKLLPPH